MGTARILLQAPAKLRATPTEPDLLKGTGWLEVLESSLKSGPLLQRKLVVLDPCLRRRVGLCTTPADPRLQVDQLNVR